MILKLILTQEDYLDDNEDIVSFYFLEYCMINGLIPLSLFYRLREQANGNYEQSIPEDL